MKDSVVDKQVFSFPPFARTDAEKLILGSMPGVESLCWQQYYAHPQNKFWTIMGELLKFDRKLPYRERVNILQNNKIALWDTVHCCVRPGSMDADIKNALPNDFEQLFRSCPKIKKVFFNGHAAHKLFSKKVVPTMLLPKLVMLRLPSTSPANASIRYAAKLAAWRQLVC